MLQEPADHHTDHASGHESDPHRRLGISEYVAQPDVVSVVERHDDDRCDKGGHDKEPKSSSNVSCLVSDGAIVYITVSVHVLCLQSLGFEVPADS